MMEEYTPTGQTALGIVPPPDVCGFVDHYRRLYMPDKMRNIEPHITITVPFVPYDKLPGVEPRLREVLAKCPPRPVALRGFSTFPEEGVLYLRLADNERVHSLYRAVLAAFPEYPAYGGKFGDEFLPHVTVGLFTDQAELERVYSELANLHLYIAFDVEDVVVKYETSDGIWDTWATPPLGEWPESPEVAED
jgi:2'-5' RNA ligase